MTKTHLNVYIEEEEIEEYKHEPDWGHPLWRRLLLDAIQEHYGGASPEARLARLRRKARDLEIRLAQVDDAHEEMRRAILRNIASIRSLIERLEAHTNSPLKLSAEELARLPSREAAQVSGGK